MSSPQPRSPLAPGEVHGRTRFTLRQELLRLINRDRKQFGLTPVDLDASVSTLGDQYCRQQIKDGTSGHFGMDGLSPYMRYSFAGGNDGVSENAAAWSAPYAFGARAPASSCAAAAVAETASVHAQKNAARNPCGRIFIGWPFRGGVE